MIFYSATKQQFVNDVRSNAIAALIEDYNETVRNESIALLPCAYLHNMKSRDAINDDFYAEHIKKAPSLYPPMHLNCLNRQHVQRFRELYRYLRKCLWGIAGGCSD